MEVDLLLLIVDNASIAFKLLDQLLHPLSAQVEFLNLLSVQQGVDHALLFGRSRVSQSVLLEEDHCGHRVGFEEVPDDIVPFTNDLSLVVVEQCPLLPALTRFRHSQE